MFQFTTFIAGSLFALPAAPTALLCRDQEDLALSDLLISFGTILKPKTLHFCSLATWQGGSRFNCV